MAAKRVRDKRKDADETAAARGSFPIVGIGTSAGGVEAMQAFLSRMPADSGIAFILIPHLDPTQQSHLAEVLAHSTAMEVSEVRESDVLRPNHLYIIPPDRYLTLERGVLHLAKPKEARGHRRPVDLFFHAVAQDQQERSICVVLSGTGSNGSAALRAVKAVGGLVIAQDPATAGYAGMPQAAIATGTVDYVLAPEQIPDVLLRYTRHPYFVQLQVPDQAGEQGQISTLLGVLRSQSQHDFRSYKLNTVRRRIYRRMGLQNIANVDDYVRVVRDDPQEAKDLIRDLMITVTGFFRDPEAWEALRATVVEPLVRDAPDNATIRAWTPGCATGEEAYTLGMLLLGEAERRKKPLDLKIFATDTANDVLEFARNGVYTAAIANDLPDDLLERYFVHEDDTYRVKQQLRETVIFAPQNVLQDPPFTHLHLVSCRNLLIYLEPEIQKRLITLFNFALRDGGHLFLGSAENLTAQEHLFTVVSKKWRIYRRIGAARLEAVEFPLTAFGDARSLAVGPRAGRSMQARPRFLDLARQVLLDEFAPASVLIDRQHRVLYFHGEVDGYLRQPSGEPTQDLLMLARDGLRVKLRALTQLAMSSNAASSARVRLQRGGQSREVQLRVTPVPAGREAEGLLLVSFEEEPVAVPAAEREPLAEDGSSTVQELEAEIRTLRQELRSTVEQGESSNEELKASNEEIMSMNEELQSANEELETSKEELQSLNEELNTVNVQLQSKIEELEARTNDLSNLLVSTNIANLCLDQQMRIRWFTPAMKELMELLPSDVGRPVSHFAHKVVNSDFLASAREVARTLQPKKAEVRSEAGRWYMRQILPYRTEDDRIEGVVVTFTDVTDLKEAAEGLRSEKEFAEQIVDTVQQPLVILDAGLRMRSANRAFYEAFQVNRDEAAGLSLYNFGDGQWNIPALRTVVEQQLSASGARSDFELEHEFKGLGQRVLRIRGRRLESGQGVLLSIEDVTERRRWEKHQQMLISELNHRVKNTLLTVQAIATQTFKATTSAEEFRERFQGRVLALARGHDLLVRSQWERISLDTLIHDVLRPFGRALLDNVNLRCSAVRLDAQAALALNLILYELATNAAKHGALSVPEGRVLIDCETDDAKSQAKLIWNETGGPTVKPPSTRGFGTVLIERSARHDLAGSASLDYRPGGLQATIAIPMEG